MAFSFSPERALIESTSDHGGPWTLCPHLSAPLGHLLADGSAILGVSTAWGKVRLDVMLDHGPATAELATRLTLADGVVTWVNTDTHYPRDCGLLCESCRESLSWPLPLNQL